MTSYLALLEADFPLLVFSIGLIFGLLVGSFLNVVIHRVPIMLERDWNWQARQILEMDTEASDPPAAFNLITPNSHCPNCDRPIKPWENIPIFSYLFLGGKCAGCKTSISLRYPLIELLTGILTGLVVLKFGLNYTSLALCVFTWALVALAMIDYDTKLLPDDITLPLLWLGLIVNSFGLVIPFQEAFWGAVAGYLSLWIVYQLFRLVTGKEGMGFGDFKLLAALGAWMGWQMLPLIVILSSLAGAVLGGSLIAFGRDRSNPIPFGPYLAIAGWIALMWGDEITSTYLQFAA